MAELQANTEQQLGSGLFVGFAIGLAMGFGIGLAGSYRLRQLQSELSEQVDDASNQFFPQHGGQNVTVRMGCNRGTRWTHCSLHMSLHPRAEVPVARSQLPRTRCASLILSSPARVSKLETRRRRKQRAGTPASVSSTANAFTARTVPIESSGWTTTYR